MRYSDARTWLLARFGDFGYPDYQGPTVHPGPTSATQLVQAESGAMVFLTVGGGAGLTTETLYDRPFIVVRVIGEQEDYDGAERLAHDIDDALLAIASPTMVGDARVLYVTRSGSGPSLLDYNGRYSFQCSYVAEASRTVGTAPVVLPATPAAPVVIAAPDDAITYYGTTSFWSIPHALVDHNGNPRLPSVAVYLASGERIEPDIVATSTLVTITFSMPVVGTAVLT